MTLYKIKEDYKRLLQLAEDPETDPEVFADTLEGLDGELEVKAEGYGIVLKQLEGDIALLESEIERLADKKTKIEARIENMRNSLFSAMKETEKAEIKTGLFNFQIKNNPPHVVLDVPAENVPERFITEKVTRNISKTAIKNAIKDGEEIDFAHLEQDEKLVIK